MIEIRDLRDFPEYIPIIESVARKEFSEFPAARPITTLIALVDGQFAGSGSLSEGDLDYGTHSEKNPWIADFFVIEEYRGRGVAKVLASSLVELGLQQYPEIYVWTKNRGLAENLLREYGKNVKYLGNREYYENIIYIFALRAAYGSELSS
jgi:GNAT superfamily N-acetyltransferase